MRKLSLAASAHAVLTLICVLSAAYSAFADWSATFEPDLDVYRSADVVTGRIRISFAAEGTEVQGSVYCRRVDFVVTGPGGIMTEMNESGLYGAEAKLPVHLRSGEEVFRPVCLVKWDGEFVFADAGSYQISVKVTLADCRTGDELRLEAKPVVVEVKMEGRAPGNYLAEFDQYSSICGFFSYALTYHGVGDLSKISFGDYDESICAYMNYQLWHSGVESRLRPDSNRKQQTLEELGTTFCLTRLGCDHCRGRWVVDGLDAMMRAGHAKGKPGTRDFRFVAGDVIY